ncbi:MAG: hypothetical protein AAF998_06815 [Bacteroidota bacterium]
MNDRLNHVHRFYSNAITLLGNKGYGEGKEVYYIRVHVKDDRFDYSKTGAESNPPGKELTWGSIATMTRWAKEKGKYPPRMQIQKFHHAIALFLGFAGFDGFVSEPRRKLVPHLPLETYGYKALWQSPSLARIKLDRRLSIPIAPTPEIKLLNLVVLNPNPDTQEYSIYSTAWSLPQILNGGFPTPEEDPIPSDDFIPSSGRSISFDARTGLAIIIGLLPRHREMSKPISVFRELEPHGFEVEFWFSDVTVNPLDPVSQIENVIKRDARKLKPEFAESDSFPLAANKLMGVIFELYAVQRVGVKIDFKSTCPQDVRDAILSLENQLSAKLFKIGKDSNGITIEIDFREPFVIAYRFGAMKRTRKNSLEFEVAPQGELNPTKNSNDFLQIEIAQKAFDTPHIHDK